MRRSSARHAANSRRTASLCWRAVRPLGHGPRDGRERVGDGEVCGPVAVDPRQPNLDRAQVQVGGGNGASAGGVEQSAPGDRMRNPLQQ
eukprot:6794838-Prymnesium_polylepis.1